MKKIMLVMLVLVLSSLVVMNASAAIGDIIGMACHTDIVARINGSDIPSFNVNGDTYIIAEDLADYGFNVYWNGEAKTLTISRNHNVSAINTVYVKPSVTPDMVGTKSYDILLSDIVAYADNEYIGGYNIDGKTIIPFDVLSRYGNVDWNGESRTISLTLAGVQIKAATQYTNNYYTESSPAFNGTVYTTPYGTKYHYSLDCAGKNGTARNLNDVINLYGPCQKCVQ